MDKKRLYRELAVLDDRGIKLFERCGYGPAIIDNHDDSEILLYLCEQLSGEYAENLYKEIMEGKII